MSNVKTTVTAATEVVKSPTSTQTTAIAMPKPSMADRMAVAKRLLKLSFPELLRIIAGISALLVNSVTNLSFPWIMGQAIDRATVTSSDIGTPLFGSNNLINGISNDYLLFLMKAAGVFVCGSMASWVRIYCLGTATDRIAYRLRKRLFNGYMDKKIEFFDTARTGEMITVLEKDTVTAAQTLTDKLANGIRSLNSSLHGSILLFSISPRLCGVALGIVPFVGVGAMAIHRYAKKVAEQLRKAESETLSYVMERINNITTVRLNGQEENEKQRYITSTNYCEDVAGQHYSALGLNMSFIGLATNISLMSILFIGGGMLGKKEMSPGTLTRFAIQSAFVGLGFSGLSTFYSDLLKSIDAAKRVFEQIDANAEQNACEGEKGGSTDHKGSAVSASATAVALPTPTSNDRTVILDNISFAYSTRPDRFIFSQFNLLIEKDSFTCIVGSSGVGKSTLLGLISGLLTPTTGTIHIGNKIINNNNEDIYEKRAWLAANIGVVEQGAAGLLSGSIYENIIYGCNSSIATDMNSTWVNARQDLRERVENAAKDASAHEFIMALPDGYDTKIGEGGKMLSGGQRARIAIARALIKRPMVLLLDEATAALDATNEDEILSVLSTLVQSKKHTIIAFTHSEAMMKAAGVIHVLEGTTDTTSSCNNGTNTNTSTSISINGGDRAATSSEAATCMTTTIQGSCRIADSGTFDELLLRGCNATSSKRSTATSGLFLHNSEGESGNGSPLKKHLQHLNQKR